MTELHTSRLVLRPARPDDAPCFALGVSDFAVARWLTPLPFPFTLAMASDWLRGAPVGTSEKAMFIIELPGRGLIGGIALAEELGFWVARPHWGKGFATEAARAVIDWHFASGTGSHISASAQHDNSISLRVKSRLGFEQVGQEMRFSHALQHNVQHILTRLTRERWMQQEGRACA